MPIDNMYIDELKKIESDFKDTIECIIFEHSSKSNKIDNNDLNSLVTALNILTNTIKEIEKSTPKYNDRRRNK